MKTKLKFFATMIGLVAAIAAQAAVPVSLDYQAFLTDAAGAPLNGFVDVNVGLWSDPVDASQDSYLYSEQHDNVPVVQGLFNIKIGTGAPDDQGAAFETSLFDESPLWLQVSINGEALVPRRALSSAAYAMRSEASDFATSTSPITGADVVDNSLSKADIIDNAAGGFQSGDQLDAVQSSPGTFRTVSLNVPAAGIALVTASATFNFTSADTVTCSITFGNSIITSHSVEASGQTLQKIPMSIVRGFDVTGTGTFAYRLVCATAGNGSVIISDSSMTALFVPAD